MAASPKHRPSFKLWLETDEGMVFGPGLYRLLRKVSEAGTLKASAEGLGMSYRFAWGLIRKAEERIGQPLVTSHKGGRSGGGGVELTEVGLQFLEEFSHIELILNELLVNRGTIELERPLTRVRAIIKEREDKDGNTELTVTVEPGDIELSIPTEKLKDVKVGDAVKVDLLALSGSLEKAED
jgi:molybdate transport repressor ModE-like protein